MSDIKIKDNHAKRVVVFAGSTRTPLGQKSQEELRKLAIIGLQSNDKTILELFDGQLPALADLQKVETSKEIKGKVVDKQ